MTNEDIERLKKKVEKDPRSKLFVPLAEEYKKRGMIDEAINVLSKGLESQPEYTSARVALGKIYLDKEMLSEAQSEFEKVVSLIPDNLLAHKRLADIYHKQGEVEKALEECRTVLKLNPNDEDTKTVMSSLTQPDEHEAPTLTGLVYDSKGSADTYETSCPDNHSEETKEPPVYEIKEEVNGSELGIEIPEKLTPIAEGPVSKDLVEFQKIMESQPEESSTREDLHNEEVTAQPEDDKVVISMPTETMADIFITQGLYGKAMNIYKEILSSDPENKRIIQRREELKMFIRLKDEKDKVK